MGFSKWMNEVYEGRHNIGDGERALAATYAAGAADEREACARLVEPKTPRPCDCERCSCGNIGDAESVARWDEAAWAAKAIRARIGAQQHD